MKKRFQFEAIRKRCKNCGNEMLATNSKEELRKEFRKSLRENTNV